ncbi:AMP-binding protein [Nonomuraea jiangxiensis]|uniref:Acyl-CoA synthetase (AMP-forming)/AMP-acid ligase II n=1 Tax=Nonomuraea jiangxiensis TaxID=633440 RepID=A0A1G9FE41_9ACTN|nr:AMP-binding protein [Nonomuraea jiangxiensis]SDK86630.1 Acyl-CoA synthetase (AMP-forming)/AMP-acid ligase II [Nonomuraea jiangxiensis]
MTADAASLPRMADLIEHTIQATPDRPALGSAGGSPLSYGQLGRLARTLARRLAERGVARADPIAVYSDNRPEFVLALLACWTIGAVVVPIDPQLTGVQVDGRLAAAGTRAVLLPGHLRDSFPGDAAAWVIEVGADRSEVSVADAGRAATRMPPGEAHGKAAQDRDLALLMFTTGSTGTPKVVPLTHGNLAASVAGIVSGYHLGPDDATLLAMPLFHGHGLIAGLLATLASGGTAYLPAAGRFSAHAFWDEIAAARATWYTAVPTIHQILLDRAGTDYPAADPPALRFIRSCSASLAPTVQRRLEERFGAPVISAYGMTETAHQATTNPLPGDGVAKAGSVGLPTGLQVRILTAAGHPAPTGETGEVCVRGPAVTDGYLDDPHDTAAAFTGGWFHTGDLGYLDPDGYLFLSGRIKELINRGGEKIAPHAVEVVLLSHPAVVDALAFGVPDATYGEEINAAVILGSGRHTTQAELQQHCRSRLTAFEIPKRIYILDRFPRTAKGDGDRRALAAAVTGT